MVLELLEKYAVYICKRWFDPLIPKLSYEGSVKPEYSRFKGRFNR